jgi:tripartite-type tricarboxylate transporter receptor subunit TctC
MSFHSLLKTIVQSSSALAILLISHAALAQSFPTKPINIVVPYPAGGASDFSARLMSKEMTVTLKQPILIDNVAGVGGALGVAKTLNAVPDGHTMVLSGVTELVLTPLANSNAKYKPEELKTVAMMGQAALMLVVRKDLGVSTIDEFVALGKRSAAKPLSYCSTGIGSQFHLVAEKFNITMGMPSLHLPYSGFPQCITNLVGQIVDYAFLPIAGPFPGFVDDGRFKLIAVTSNVPHSRFNKAPMVKSTKGLETFVFSTWAGFHVSNKVPDDVIAILNKSAMAAMETSEIKAQFATSGSQMFAPMSPSEAHAFYLREVAQYQAIAKSINLQQQ